MHGTPAEQRLDSSAAGEPIGLRDIALLASVGRVGSIQRAATENGMSQPGATQALALLQRRANAQLLSRGLTGSALTVAGRQFLSRTEPLLGRCATAIAGLGVGAPDEALRGLTTLQLGLLALVLETGSLERAAQAAGSSRSAARRTAGAIEARLGTLFERTPEGTCLTAAAEPCVRTLVMAMHEIALAARDVRAALSEADNTLVVGAAQAFGNRFLAKLLVELADVHPEARITVLRESPAELVTRLRAGEVDLVVGDIDEVGADLIMTRLVATPYFVFARPGHPLTRLSDIGIGDLAGYDWVGGTPGSVREQMRAALFAGAPVAQVAFAASEGAVVGHFVAGSDRLALMTEHESRCGGLALGKLPFPPLESGLGIDVVRRADRAPSALHEELVLLLREHLAPVENAPGRERRAA